jgi:hypothetical protein
MRHAGDRGQLDEAHLLSLGVGGRWRDEVGTRDADERGFERARIVEVAGDKGGRRACGWALSGFRTIPRTFAPRASSCCKTAEPVFPVAPVTRMRSRID